jgi:prophage maintenance system killer protein
LIHPLSVTIVNETETKTLLKKSPLLKISHYPYNIKMCHTSNPSCSYKDYWDCFYIAAKLFLVVIKYAIEDEKPNPNNAQANPENRARLKEKTL